MTRRFALLTAAVLMAVALTSCGRPGDGGYKLRASFTKAVALYPLSIVKVMGISIGHVTAVNVKDDHIEVEMVIDRAIPLPDDVEATIVPLSLIGERNIVLSPAWTPGKGKIQDGATIAKTHVPVEPDEALKAITDLANAIDPAAVQKLVSSGAKALAGRGADLNASLLQAGDLTRLLAAQDQTLLSIATNFHKLAATLQSRQEKLGKLLDDFAAATNVLASERDSIAAFLRSLTQLTREGGVLLESYKLQLPQDVASLANVVLTLKVNAGSVAQVLRAVDEVGTGVVEAYDPVSGGAKVRLTGTPTAMMALNALFALLGLGPAPCIPLPDTVCPP
jgi:virulence factor Mce-like protein